MLLLEQGYAATTMTAVANAAGVSDETIYKTVGGKAALVKAVRDITLVGDDEPVPLAQRPEFAAIYAEPDPRPENRSVRRVGHGATATTGRCGSSTRERATKSGTLISPEVRRLLVDGRGWSIEEYETWVSGVLMGMVRP